MRQRTLNPRPPQRYDLELPENQNPARNVSARLPMAFNSRDEPLRERSESKTALMDDPEVREIAVGKTFAQLPITFSLHYNTTREGCKINCHK